MADYIDRGSIMRTAHILRPEDKELMSAISSIPADDVAPVRHGQWEEADWIEPDHKGFELIRTPKAAWRCSKCHHCFKKELLWRDNYCPNCGARMDGAE